MNRIVNDLTVHFMAINIAKTLNLFQLALSDGNGQFFLLSFFFKVKDAFTHQLYSTL